MSPLRRVHNGTSVREKDICVFSLLLQRGSIAVQGVRSMTINEIFMTCGHCGNKSNCKVKTRCTDSGFDDEVYSEANCTWLVLQCPSCWRPILVEVVEEGTTYVDKNSPIYNCMNSRTIYLKPYEMAEVLYPREKSRSYSKHLPYRIQHAYEAALRVKSEPNAFAVLVGRTLEVICKNENARGRTLADKIRSLANSGRIPDVLGEMATQLRELRNLGAHADEDEDEVTQEDVETIQEFTEAILEYLYVAPSKIARLRDRGSGKLENGMVDWEQKFVER
jgi:hypothetical protein